MSRRKRSTTRDVSCPREESVNEFELARPESNKRGRSRQENGGKRKLIRRQIDNDYQQETRSTHQQKNDNKVDHKHGTHSSPWLKKDIRKHESDALTRRNEGSGQRGRVDHDTNRDSRSRKHSNSQGDRGTERDRPRHRLDHDTHRDRSRTHSDSHRGVTFRDHTLPQPRTPYDKRRIFTDVKKLKQ